MIALLHSAHDVFSHIEAHLSMLPHAYALKLRKEHPDWPVKEMAELLDCYQRAQQKFPNMHRMGMMYTRKALEQSTGEALLRWKQTQWKGTSALDATGGLGMDSVALAGSFQSVTYLECDAEPFALARHNHSLLGISNIQHHCTLVESFLHEHIQSYDLIYIDPSRRDERGRVVQLSKCSPDVTQLWELLRQSASTIVVKVSPMYDIVQLQRELPELSAILVVSVHGEVKEILGIWEKSHEGRLRIQAIGLDSQGKERFRLSSNDETAATPRRSTVTPSVGMRLYEPDAAIIKAGLSSSLCGVGCSYLNHQTDYLLGDKSDLQGVKSYMISVVMDYKPKTLKQYLKNSGIQRVHIHVRDFKERVDELYKRLACSMGDQAHLFFTKNAEGKQIVLICIE